MSFRSLVPFALLLLAGCSETADPPPGPSYAPCATTFDGVPVECKGFLAPIPLATEPTGTWTCVERHDRTRSEYRLLRGPEGQLAVAGTFKSPASTHFGRMELWGPDAPDERIRLTFTLDGDRFFVPVPWSDGISLRLMAWSFEAASERTTALLGQEVLLQEVQGSLWYTVRLVFEDGETFVHPMTRTAGGFLPLPATHTFEFPDGQAVLHVRQSDGIEEALTDPNVLPTGPVVVSDCDS